MSKEKAKKNKNFLLTIIGTVIISGFLPVAIIVSGNFYFSNLVWIGESFHAFIEAIGAFSAIMFAVLFLMGKLDKRMVHQLWISCALLSMGILDGFHASVPPGEISIWLRSSSTLFGGFLFALVWLPARPLFIRSPEILIWSLSIIVSVFAGYSMLFPASIPAMAVNGDFTFAAKILNLAGGIFFLISSAYFIGKYHGTRKTDDLFFVNLCLLFGVAGLLYHVSSPWNAGWWFWHFLRLTAYLHILGYVFTLYRRRKEALQMAYDELESRIKRRTTALLKTNQKLQASELRLRKIITNNADSIIIISQNGIVSFVNPAATTLFDRKFEEFIGQKFEFPVSDSGTSEIQITREDGTKTIAQMRVTQIEWGGKVAYLASCRDVTEIVKLREELKAMSLVDELTQLYNRRGFFELSNQQLKISQRLKNVILLIFVDLDNMKSINDNWGHHAGDQALVDAATILKGTFRKSDIIGRIGGDEFAILAIEASKGNINTINNRLQQRINSHNNTQDRPYYLSMSMGIARFYPESKLTLNDLIDQADEQMYLQKRKKKKLAKMNETTDQLRVN